MTKLAYKRILKFQNEGYHTLLCPDFNDFRADMKQKKKAGVFKKRWGKCICFPAKPKSNPRGTWGDVRTLPGI
jgi:hypothetical protein